jgi:hypothetical protein
MDGAERFFSKIVLPALEKSLCAPLVERKAMRAITELDTMAEIYFLCWVTKDPLKLRGATTSRSFRRKLASEVCADAQLIWDLAASHKQVVRTWRQRKLVAGQKTNAWGGIRWVEKIWAAGMWEEGPLVVTADDGRMVELPDLIWKGHDMWSEILGRQF